MPKVALVEIRGEEDVYPLLRGGDSWLEWKEVTEDELSVIKKHFFSFSEKVRIESGTYLTLVIEKTNAVEEGSSISLFDSMMKSVQSAEDKRKATEKDLQKDREKRKIATQLANIEKDYKKKVEAVKSMADILTPEEIEAKIKKIEADKNHVTDELEIQLKALGGSVRRRKAS